jgi:hypothetical protein
LKRRWAMMKVLGLLFLSLSFCLPGSAAKNVASVDSNAIEQEIRNAVRDLQIQLPELLKAIRINVQIPNIKVDISKIQVPEIHIPEIHVEVPLDLQIPELQLPEIHMPEIHVEIPRIDIHTPESPE